MVRALSGRDLQEVALRIGELAERTGVSVRSLRYYEDEGLLVSRRTVGGHRVYDPAAVDRVIRIQELYAAGLNSTKIRDILPCMRDTDGGPSERATPLLADTLRAERDRIDRQLRELQRTRDVLDDVIATAGVDPPDHRARKAVVSTETVIRRAPRS